MISNHEEYSNDITLENLKWRKSNKELEVIELPFSNFLYNNNFKLLFKFCRTVFMQLDFCWRLFPTAV